MKINTLALIAFLLSCCGLRPQQGTILFNHTSTAGISSIGPHDGDKSIRINGEKNVDIVIDEQSQYTDGAFNVFRDGPSANPLFQVTRDGNVGLGTNAPDSKLHIYVPSRAPSYPTSTSKGDVVQSIRSNNNGVEIGNSRGFNDRKAWILARHSSVGTYGQYYSALHLQPDGGNKTQYKGVAIGYPVSSNLPKGTHLAVNGKVGIGTLSPDMELTVKGNIHAEEVKVDLNVPAPDYVFKKDYDLKSLEEVQDYIKAHGHLPNIPSAKEMEANGIPLGEMNMKLLEKIEELTLYVIELENRDRHYKEKFAKLESILKIEL